MNPARLLYRLLTPVDRLAAALADPARRERTVVAVLVVYAVLWTLYGTLAKASQDIHIDMSEMVAWSRELAFGYSKHPPLAAWLTSAWFAVFPTADWVFYLLAMTMATFALVDRVAAGRRLPRRREARAGAAAADARAVLQFSRVEVQRQHRAASDVGARPRGASCARSSAAAPAGRRSRDCAPPARCSGNTGRSSCWLGLGLAALLDSRRGRVLPLARALDDDRGRRDRARAARHLAGRERISCPSPMRPPSTPGPDAVAAKSIAGYLAGSVGYVALPVLLALAAMRPSRAAIADMLWPAGARAAACRRGILVAAAAAGAGRAVGGRRDHLALVDVGLGAAAGRAAVVAAGR